MNIFTKKTSKLIGVIKAPPSKSYTHRAIMIGAIDGECEVANPLYSDDTVATINALRQLGAIIKKEPDSLNIKGFSGQPSLRSRSINVGESGTLLRFILPIISLAKGNFKVQGRKTLLRRSNRTIVEALRSWDIDISGRGESHKLPIILKSKGMLKGGEIYVSGRESSQVISSLLVTAAFTKSDTAIILKDKLVSRPYVDVTIDVLQKIGIEVKNENYERFYVGSGQNFKPKQRFVIHGDYSSVSFLIAAASLIPSDITILDLIDDKQGDKKIISILNNMGARIEYADNAIKVKGPFELKGIDIDAGDTPDLVPILTVLGAFAKGKTTIYNIAHLAHKESNRITMPAGELIKLGARLSTTPDSIIVNHSSLKPAHVLSCGDHRIAMALVVAGLSIGDVKIKGIECISKSYPNFLQHIKSLGAEFR